MKAILCKSLDGPDALFLEDVEEPVAGPNEVVVQVRGAALNFFDTLITRGRYQYKPDLPFSPAGEISGIVRAVGTEVTKVKVGARVMAYLGWGGAREAVAVSEDQIIPVPDSVSDEVAAGVTITYGTALHGLVDRASVGPGDAVAVLGASGGAGLAAVEISKLLGARVVAVASTEDKLAICRDHGADDLVSYKNDDLKGRLKDLTEGDGVDVIYDCVGGNHAEPAMRAMAWGGRYLVVGFASGEIPIIPLNILLLKGCAAIGVFWGEAVKREPSRHRANMTQLLSWIADGKLTPRIERVFALEDAREALRLFDQRKTNGKIILKI